MKLRSYDALATPVPGASEFATTIRRLAADFPDSTAGWNVYDIDPNRAPSIRSDHGLPGPAQITLWEALAQIAPTKGDFNESRHDRNRFSIDALPAEPVMVAQLRLIADSGLPATVYNVVTNQITVRPGGCSKDVQEPGPRTADADLQARLRSQFERC